MGFAWTCCVVICTAMRCTGRCMGVCGFGWCVGYYKALKDVCGAT